jgi:hypothetical protein
VNQVANLAFVEYPDNVDVSDSAPSDYVTKVRSSFSESSWTEMNRAHALPSSWETLSYEEFLRERRKLMARIIRQGFEALGDKEVPASDAKKFAAADEKKAWDLIEDLELRLRRLVHEKYEAKWGSGADARIIKQLTPDEVTALEGHRAKHAAAYPLAGDKPKVDLLDYFYLGQLVKLVLFHEIWNDFVPVFGKRKDTIQETIAKVSAVRNDRAHFRPVPEKELQRCVLACDDLLTMMKKADEPVAGAGVSGTPPPKAGG